MKKLMEKQTAKKIIILIIIVLSFNFIMPTYSQADFGGVLMGPIIDFVSGIGDAVLSALQFFMYDGNISVKDTATSAVSGALKLVNPLDTFLLARKSDNFNSKLQEYGMDGSGETADIEIDTEEFDKGWFGWLPGTWADKDYGVPIIKYTPEKIFANQVPALDVNFINPIDWTDIKDKNGSPVFQNADAMNEHSITIALHSTIANWYVALRNLAIVALLSVLLYVGIRMVISSTATDKSKYKQMLMDWVIALCIVFFLHYLMSFVLSITSMITQGIDSGNEIIVKAIDSGNGDFQFKTDLTGLCRFQIQYKDLGARFVYLVMYIALVIYTVMFTWTYVKRAITMAFLTLMAPLVAITYPIDKIGDGKAQAFGIWLKEFIFNALLQPFHLIIYTIFLGAASEIAVKNPVYAILFLAFIIPSEKLLRKMFGFDKSSTAGAMSTAAGMFGGAAAFKMLSGAINGKAKSKGSSGGSKDTIRTQKSVEDANAPEGYSAFASSSRTNNTGRIASRTSLNSGNQASSPDGMPNMPNMQNANNNSYAISGGEELTSGGSYAISAGVDNERGINPISADTSSDIRFAPDSARLSDDVRPPYDSDRPKKPLTRKDRTINGVRALRKATINKENMKKLGKLAGKGAIRTVTAGTGLAVGLGMGIAGNDLEDVLTYGAAGTALGAKALGDVAINAGNKGKSGLGKASNTFKEGYYGINEAAMRRQRKEFTKDAARREYFATEFAENDQKISGKKLNEIMEQGAYYNNVGITDNSAIKKSIKLEKSIKAGMNDPNLNEDDKTKMAREQAATISKIADQVDDNKLRTDEKYVEGLRNNFMRGLKKANSNMSDRDLATQSENMMNLLKQYKKID